MLSPASADFDKRLISYQKWAISLCYPSIMSLFSLFVGLFRDDYSYALCLALSREMDVYFTSSPFLESEIYSKVLVLGTAALIAGLSVFLALKAAKAKFWALIVGIVIYFADSVYALCLYGTMESQFVEWVLMVVVHVGFLAIFAFALTSYAKLWRLEAKLREQQHGNAGNISK